MPRNEALAPSAYLSTSRGLWRVIYQGLPLCADTTRERAEACARQFRLALAPRLWNGDVATWQEAGHV